MRHVLVLQSLLIVGVSACAQESFYAMLASPCRVSVSNSSARSAIDQISTGHHLNIWLDRRIDPTTPVRIEPSTESVGQALDRLAAALDAEIGFADPVAIIAPHGQAIGIASAILDMRNRLRSGPKHEKMLRRYDIAWQRLTTPNEAGQQIARTWALDEPLPSLPHDLLAEAKLRQLDLPAATILLASGFGKMPASISDAGLTEWQPFDSAIAATLSYPSAKISTELKTALLKIDSSVTLRSSGGLVRVTGSSAVHHAIQKNNFVRAPRPQTEPSVKRFTLRVVGKPAISVLKALCSASGLELETAAASKDRLAGAVGLDVQDLPVIEIINSICGQVKLTADQRGDQVFVSDQ